MKTCLIVDDSSIIRKVARRILEDLDFQIAEAADGEKALEVCKLGMPQAISVRLCRCQRLHNETIR
jgi:two-component system chemotaxis response regulator CheY